MTLPLEYHRYRLTLTEQLLGAVPKNRDVYTRYIVARAEEARKTRQSSVVHAPDEIALEADDAERLAEDADDKGRLPPAPPTGFLEDEQGIYLLDHVIRGFLKESAGVLDLNTPGKRAGAKPVALGKSVIDRYVFVFPRQIRFLRDGKALTQCEGYTERSLRAMTAQGPRVTVARSDVVDAGATMDIKVGVVKGRVDAEKLDSLFEYGEILGLGQWRTGSYGRFTTTRLE